MPPDGISVGSSARAGCAAQVVAVHRDVERADGDLAALDRRGCARRPGGRGTRRASGCRAGRGRRRPWRARRSRGRRASARGRSRHRRGRCVRRQESGQRTSLRPPSPPHRTDLKDVGRLRPYPTARRPGTASPRDAVTRVPGRVRRLRRRAVARGHLSCRCHATRTLCDPAVSGTGTVTQLHRRAQSCPPNGRSPRGANGGSRSVTS